MKGNLIAFGMKLVGLGGLWDKLDGMKTYLGASAGMFTGFGLMLTNAAILMNSFVADTHSLGDVVNFVQGQFQHPGAPSLEFALGWGMVLSGWNAMAKKHAEDKKHAELLAAATLASQSPAPEPAKDPAPEAPKP